MSASRRKSFGPHRREKKFFLVGATGAGQTYWTFASSHRMVTSDPYKAKRLYSKKAANAFLVAWVKDANPYMTYAVLPAIETENDIKVSVPTSGERVKLDMREFLPHAKDPRLSAYKQNPSYSVRIDRLGRLIQSQIEKLEATLKSHGKNSALYRKVEKSLNRLIEMKRREVAKSRTPGTKAYAKRWNRNPSPKFNIGESAYYVTGSGVSRKRYLVEIVLLPKFDEYTNTYSYKVRGKTLPWSSGVWTHEGSLERVDYKKNPSKGFRERSDRLHKMRAKVLASLKKLMRSGNTKEAEKLRARIMRIDRMIYHV